MVSVSVGLEGLVSCKDSHVISRKSVWKAPEYYVLQQSPGSGHGGKAIAELGKKFCEGLRFVPHITPSE